MNDFLLELLSEEIPARMQAKARADLARLFAEQLAAAGIAAQSVETHATPRRLALIARNLPAEAEAVSEEIKGPRANAPPQALEGFLRKTGLSRDRLAERDGVLFAQIEKPGRATADMLAEAIPAIVRAFPWPKSMRWGAASASTESPRWVRPLQGIVALLGEEIVEFEIAGVQSGAATVGHRFHHPGIITIGGAHDYVEKLRACHVIVDADERARLIREGAVQAAAAAGLTLVEDEALVAENAGLTEWPVPLLGRFDPAFLQVPREVIQLTMRTNQKYFACTDGEGRLAPNFICTANIEASDNGAAIVAGNERVLSARLADAKFFWEQDLRVSLEEQAKKLGQIVFHEKLGTVADKVNRVAKLARWLVEEGIVGSKTLSPGRRGQGEGALSPGEPSAAEPPHPNHRSHSLVRPGDEPAAPIPAGERESLAALAETAARLCKADLVTGLVGEFPELQGVIGGHLARAQGLDPQIADAIRDHYKPVGQGDDVPTSPVTVAVSLADKLDTLLSFFEVGEYPTGSRDPYALRRAALSVVLIIFSNVIRFELRPAMRLHAIRLFNTPVDDVSPRLIEALAMLTSYDVERVSLGRVQEIVKSVDLRRTSAETVLQIVRNHNETIANLLAFFAERLKVQQREAGVRHDLIDAVFALGGEDDLVRLLARVKALQAFVESPQGADLLAGYKRAANILKKEGYTSPVRVERSRDTPSSEVENDEAESLAFARQDPSTSLGTNGPRHLSLSYSPEKAEADLIAALDSAGPKAEAAVAAEDFEGAMKALATLRAPVDAFFEKVIVNDPDPAKREARLALLARMRDAVHRVADFSRIEG